MVITANAGLVDEFVEDEAYKIVEEGIITSGKSEDQAKCIVKVLRATGASRDVTDKRSLFQTPSELAQKLQGKVETADFLCTHGTAMWIGTAFVLLFICFMIFCICIESTSKPRFIRMPQHRLFV
jgi:uncharacterized membrane-anchored protein